MGLLSSGSPAPNMALQQGRRPVGSGHITVASAARARPTSSSRDQLLPVLPALAPLFPRGGLQRGGVVTVGTGDGGTTLGWALLAAVSAASWCAAVGLADPGMVACAGLGVDLSHLVLVPRPGPSWAQVAATLFDGMDVVLLRPPGAVRPGVARRLAARARERRGVLVVLGAGGWPEGADVQLTVGAGAWQGVEAGHGHLRGRHLDVVASGRRAAARPVRVGLWLPDPSGQVVAGDRDRETERSDRERSNREGANRKGDGAAAAGHLVPGHP